MPPTATRGPAGASAVASPPPGPVPPISRPACGPRTVSRQLMDEATLGKVVQLIASAQRPLLMIGHGVIVSGAYDAVRKLAERTGMPVITTLLGISAFPQEHELHLGMPGMHGEVHINKAIQAADLIDRKSVV